MFTLLKDIILSNFIRLKTPYKLTFSLTNQCNARCITCKIWKKETEGELKFNELDIFFKKNNYFSWIDLTGGEIFLRDDILEVIKMIVRRCKNLYLLHFPTNGLLPSRIKKNVKKIRTLFSKKLIVTVSVDGPPDLHNYLKGRDDAWKKSIKTFFLLKEIEGIEVYMGMTISNDNYCLINRTLEKVKEVSPKITFDDLHINIFHKSAHFYNNSNLENIEKNKVNHSIKKFITDKGVKLNPISLLEYLYLKNIENYFSADVIPLKCKALSSSVFISADGGVFPCSIYSRKISDLRKIDYDLRKIWNSEKVLDLYKSIRRNECSGCWTPCEAYQSILGNFIKIFNRVREK